VRAHFFYPEKGGACRTVDPYENGRTIVGAPADKSHQGPTLRVGPRATQKRKRWETPGQACGQEISCNLQRSSWPAAAPLVAGPLPIYLRLLEPRSAAAAQLVACHKSASESIRCAPDFTYPFSPHFSIRPQTELLPLQILEAEDISPIFWPCFFSSRIIFFLLFSRDVSSCFQTGEKPVYPGDLLPVLFSCLPMFRETLLLWY
jgi:hypothetical protein